MTLGFLLLAVILVALVVMAAMLLRTRPSRRQLTTRQATVVRAIPAGGFGQVRLEQGDATVLLAARTAGGESLPVGSVVEIVDDSRSVLVVQRLCDAP